VRRSATVPSVAAAADAPPWARARATVARDVRGRLEPAVGGRRSIAAARPGAAGADPDLQTGVGSTVSLARHRTLAAPKPPRTPFPRLPEAVVRWPARLADFRSWHRPLALNSRKCRLMRHPPAERETLWRIAEPLDQPAERTLAQCHLIAGQVSLPSSDRRGGCQTRAVWRKQIT
jgi:hypothetical protein